MGFGDRLKSVRKENNLTQEQLAESLGIHLSHISHVERGTREPSEQLVKSIALLFDLNEEWLKNGTNPKCKPLKDLIKSKMARFGGQAILDAVRELLGQPADQTPEPDACAIATDPQVFYEELAVYGGDAPYIPGTSLKMDVLDYAQPTTPEEALKNIMARFGEQAMMEAYKNMLKENGLAVAPMRLAHREDTGDPDLDRMINILHDLWAAGDEDLKGWTKVQFNRSFPADVVEEVQKKEIKTHGQAQVG